jgi:hypothetical protein
VHKDLVRDKPNASVARKTSYLYGTSSPCGFKVGGGELKLDQKSYCFFHRLCLFWILNGYNKNIVKKILIFIKNLELRLPFEFEISTERSKFKIEIFKF